MLTMTRGGVSAPIAIFSFLFREFHYQHRVLKFAQEACICHSVMMSAAFCQNSCMSSSTGESTLRSVLVILTDLGLVSNFVTC